MSTSSSKLCASQESCSSRKNPMKQYIYSIQKKNRYTEDFVDAMLRIVDDVGPQPMRDLKPVQRLRESLKGQNSREEADHLPYISYFKLQPCQKKNPNGAEKFDEDHQAEYEARGKQSRDQVGQVQQHNRAYPKMYDELDRRRSTARVTAVHSMRKNSTIDQMEYDPKCNACVRSKRLSERNCNINHRYNRNYNRKPRCYDNRSRITKQRRRIQKKRLGPCRSRGISKLKSIGCQCSNDFYSARLKINRMTSAIFSKLEPLCHEIEVGNIVPVTNESPQCLDKIGPNQDPSGTNPLKSTEKEDNESNSNTDIASRNPDNSQPSLSSYDSYMSMDHEPMVLP